MNVLAFDTCFGAVSAAVRWRSERGEWLLRESYQTLAVGHAERLLPIIDEVMAAAQLTYGQLDRIAVTLGPGGFTGLRVGIATARALALATGLPVVGLSSLAIMAERAIFLLGDKRAGRPIVVAVDARRGALYVQSFGENAGDPLSEPQLLSVNEAAASLPASPLIIVGSGGPLLQTSFTRAGQESLLPELQPHARQLVLLAPALAPMHPVVPLYLRAADAKPSSAQPLPRRTGP